jgi:hypothetical protein
MTRRRKRNEGASCPVCRTYSPVGLCPTCKRCPRHCTGSDMPEAMYGVLGGSRKTHHKRRRNKGYVSEEEIEELRRAREEAEARRAWTPPAPRRVSYPTGRMAMVPPSRSNPYYVRIPKDGIAYGPYRAKLQAFDFARIGSQQGSPREVYQGRKRIRRYVGGKMMYRGR